MGQPSNMIVEPFRNSPAFQMNGSSDNLCGTYFYREKMALNGIPFRGVWSWIRSGRKKSALFHVSTYYIYKGTGLIQHTLILQLIDWPKYSWCSAKESSVLSKRIVDSQQKNRRCFLKESTVLSNRSDDAKRKQSIYSQKSLILGSLPSLLLMGRKKITF